ncbi:precorrin-2 dehydrogenase/sirohydrochlorin ferrochelatase family protein [Chengkuizengella marina]|uniref:precorrin-2 dehydrogenase n=1 Tax=Chengkuizengella marina TaxID=2507566 RepID=A0A6N9Q0W7_9BACL|nr:bifunctional precorrin-2 dehydrogenase/sirohydrochlorin ferrochelatase [Chengkuizengella marina]NBI28792.1 bifunctional precorrin-2 dehydrogenase/sirohydrochlorin ferrochelatase [Chengkuizengella marina]
MYDVMPIMINVKQKECLVVGGGKIAERKISSLMDAMANIKVISPKVTVQIKHWHNEGKLQIYKKNYDVSQIGKPFLIIAATDQSQVNLQVYEDAKKRNILVSIVDRPDYSDFIFPASFKRGKLQIAVSTSGASPIVARTIKKDLEKQYGDDYEIYLDFLGEFRSFVKKTIHDTKQRQALYKEIMDLDILRLIRIGKFHSFQKELYKRLKDPDYKYNGNINC